MTLQPSPSLSRAGKAETAMRNMNKSTSLTSPSSKKKRELLPIDDVIPIEVYDRFGVGAGSDRGRSSELVSSPRGTQPDTPDANSPQRPPNEPSEEELVRQFLSNPHVQKRLAAGRHTALVAAAAATTPSAPSPRSMGTPRSEREAVTAEVLGEDQPESPTSAAKSKQWSVFKSATDRFKPTAVESPPVGRYRPKYGHVEAAPRQADFNYRPPSPTKRAHVEDQEAAYVNERAARLAEKEERHSSPPVQPQPAVRDRDGGADPKFRVDYEWVSKHAPKRDYQNAVFASSTERQEQLEPQSPDKYYWPYAESLVKKREPGVDMERQVARDDIFARNAASPNKYYDLNHSQVRRKEEVSLSMDKQLAKGRAMQDAQTMASKTRHETAVGATRPGWMQYPADARFYDTMDHFLSTRDRATSPDLGRTLGREEAALASQFGARAVMHDPVVDYDPKKPASVRPVKVDMRRQLGRPSHPKVFADLEYEVEYGQVDGRTPSAPIDVLTGHRAIFADALTKDLDYSPSTSLTKPKSAAFSFDRGVERAQSPSALQVRFGTKHIDKYYDIDEALDKTRPRTTGDPLMRTHLSRKDMDRIYRSRATNLDKFYDASVAPTKPRSPVLSDMTKDLDRAQRSAGRFAPGTQRQADASARSPDVGTYSTERGEALISTRIPTVVLTDRGSMRDMAR